MMMPIPRARHPDPVHAIQAFTRTRRSGLVPARAALTGTLSPVCDQMLKAGRVQAPWYTRSASQGSDGGWTQLLLKTTMRGMLSEAKPLTISIQGLTNDDRFTMPVRKREPDRWKHARAAPVDTMNHPRSGDAGGVETAFCFHHHRVTVSRTMNSIAAAGSVISGSHAMASAIHRQRQQVKPT